MASASGRYVIAYNGEIYNFRELRGELSGYPFRSRSDTEVMLAAFERWGVVETLERLNGMFAFALWDTEERALWLARDRFGEKPLYYGRVGRALVFGSELKALRRFPGFAGEIDRGALAQFMRLPTSRPLDTHLRRHPEAPRVELRAVRGGRRRCPDAHPLLERRVRRPQGDGAPLLRGRRRNRRARHAPPPHRRSAHGLRRAARRVPLRGDRLLFGRRDDAGCADRQGQDVHDRLRGGLLDEADSAKAVAAHLGTDHTELYVTAAQALAVVPRLSSLYDEPFADPSQIPTFLVSSLARRHVTVALSGDGGDELFGGYNRYVWADAIWRRVGKVPFAGRAWLASGLGALRPSTVDRWFALADAHLPARLRQRMPGDKLQKLAEVLPARSADESVPPARVDVEGPRRRRARRGASARDPGGAPAGHRRLRRADDVRRPLTYLPDDILVKVDRAAMGVSLETRVPFLDANVLRFAWSLPKTLRIREGKGKWNPPGAPRSVRTARAVRAAEDGVRHANRLVAARAAPRLGGEQPRGGAPGEGGYLNPGPIRTKWREHLSGRRNWQDHLWPALMFQAWRETWGEERAADGRGAVASAAV